MEMNDLTEIIKSGEAQQDTNDPVTLLTNKKQIKFLQEIILPGGSIRKAAEIAGISTSSHHDWLSKQEIYREAFENAYEKSTRILEAEAIR